MNMKIVLHWLLALLLIIVITELALRILILNPAATQEDPILGWVYKPGAEILHSSEGYARNTLNSLGLNDQESDLLPSPIYRVLLMGDSYTEAFQVERSHNFSEITQRKSCSTVINTGRSGATPLHYPEIARRLASLHPQMGVIVFSAGDISDLRQAKYKIEYDQNQQPMDVKLQFPPLSKLRQQLGLFIEHSALLTQLKNRMRLVEFDGLFNFDQPPGSAPKKRAPRPAFRSEQEQHTLEQLVTYLLKQVNQLQPTSILYIPDYTYLIKGRAEETLASKQGSLFLQKISQSLNLPFQRVEGFDTHYSQTNQPPVGFPNSRMGEGHLNRVGHQLTATSLLKLVGNHCQDGEASKP